MKRHAQDKPYSCTTCQKSFVRREHLDTHVRSHTGETPYRFFFFSFSHFKTFQVEALLSSKFVSDVSIAPKRSLAKNTWSTTSENTRAKPLTDVIYVKSLSLEKNIL